jgi:hypothetical protein
MQLWQEQLQPKVEEKGGPRAVAEETLKSAEETLKNVTGNAGSESSKSTEAERRKRKQRRDQRRRALEKSS